MKISKKKLKVLIEQFLLEEPDGLYPTSRDMALSKYKAEVYGDGEESKKNSALSSFQSEVKEWYDDEGRHFFKTFDEVWDNTEAMVMYFKDDLDFKDLYDEYAGGGYTGYTPFSFYVKAYIWPLIKSGEIKVHLPVYAFLRYLCGDSSDLNESEIAAIYKGNDYLNALTNVLDIAAKPNDGTYEDGHLKNGYALKWDNKPYAFYVVNYQVHWGESGDMATEWMNALTLKGDIGRHWGPTLGNSGIGGSQLINALKSGDTGEALLRPDFNKGYHLVKNEFDFKRMVSKSKGIDEIDLTDYFKDLMKQVGEAKGIGSKIERVISWILGRSLKVGEIIAGFPSPAEFNFDFKVKSNISKWPSFSEYPMPNSAKNLLNQEPKLSQSGGVLDEISHIQKTNIKYKNNKKL